MKKITFLTLLMFASIATFAQTPILTMISDGDCPGGNPKIVEIYAQGTVDFSNYSLENQTNANTDWGNTLNLADLGTVTDDFVYVYADDASFSSEYPSASITLATTSSVVNFNGDDRIRIIQDSNSAVIDQYGEDSVDGTGEVWEYKDGYAKRNNGTTATGTFNASDWTYFNGVLDGEGTCQGGSTFESIIEIGTFSAGANSCMLVVISETITCDAETAGTDTYTTIIEFSGGGSETYTLTSTEGTIGGDDPSTQETGVINITGVDEGVNFDYSIIGGNCDITNTITAPTCDPANEVLTISELREGTVGEIYTVTGEVILTFQQDFRGQKYIEDNTGAILIDDPSGVITTTYNMGDGITAITGELNEYNGIMQLIPTEDPGTPTTTGNVVGPQIITLSEYIANYEDYESEVIAFENVSIAEGDGTATFSTGTNYTLTNGSLDIVLRTQFYDADYIGTEIPATTLDNLVGIAAQFDNGTDPVEPQIFPRSLADFNANLATDNPVLTDVSIYPNPANGNMVNIQTKEAGSIQVNVFNMLGKQVMTKTVNNSLNIQTLATGVYLLQITQEGKTATKKLIVQ
ncbi:T9SS type A sorting domain-containing protein [Haloflavibacter putidus]|uniref:T9SS type A sorting domain-containing protein n=1 Tax=Haloflavibacter putidus TaxID=2576776 RepID=A0A507ZPR4_9FLAO|nr:T9SS type A sorting domain-containing protein [Haloflavibacter putidus]TQD38571.1 T9SS type A sorting domain-containing protein [Haloflavibacter putidus]